MSDPLIPGEAACPDSNRGVTLPQLKFLNTAAFVLTLALNGLSSTGALSAYTVGEISDKHRTKITPAGAAFSIWGVIYLLQGCFIAYQFFWPHGDELALLHGIGFWFLGACAFNSLWIVTFVQGTNVAIWISTVLIACLLFCLCKIHLNASCWARERPGGITQTAVVDVHFSMYAGWVTVATIVNVAVALTTTGWQVDSATANAWSVTMLLVALGLNLVIVATRKDCVWGLVLAWASFWIADANKDNDTVHATALVVCAIITAVSIGVGALLARAKGQGGK